MKKVSFVLGEQVNGFEISEIGDNGFYVAENKEIALAFTSTAGEGRNYCNPAYLINKVTNKSYVSTRYLLKHVSTIQGFSNALFQSWKKANGQ